MDLFDQINKDIKINIDLSNNVDHDDDAETILTENDEENLS